MVKPSVSDFDFTVWYQHNSFIFLISPQNLRKVRLGNAEAILGLPCIFGRAALMFCRVAGLFG